MADFHPDLAVGRFIPRLSLGPRSARLIRRFHPRAADLGPAVTVEHLEVSGPADGPPVALRLLRPACAPESPGPALLWVHGGGLVIGEPAQDDRANATFVRELGITVAAVRYRLAPDAQAPAAAKDVHQGLLGLVAHAERLGLDPDRIAIGGGSAGGGIAAAATLLAHDRGGVRPAFQLLVYPMLDDRTVTRTDVDPRRLRVWTTGSNRFGWSAYLGVEPGSPGVSPYAAPARRTDLAGLPPAWIGVGTHDLFHDEDLDYARRLQAAGVPCQVHVVPGAFHGFDALFPGKDVSRDFLAEQVRALRTALFSGAVG